VTKRRASNWTTHHKCGRRGPGTRQKRSNMRTLYNFPNRFSKIESVKDVNKFVRLIWFLRNSENVNTVYGACILSFTGKIEIYFEYVHTYLKIFKK
jgi:hypothetical protein